MKSIRTFVLAFLTISLPVDAADTTSNNEASAQNQQRGLTIKKAIEVCDEDGAEQYLARLVCPDGKRPDFKRLRNYDWRSPIPEKMSKEDSLRFFSASLNRGALAPGQIDYHITTGYRVKCGKNKTVIYLDTYHCAQPVPIIAPTGFSITN